MAPKKPHGSNPSRPGQTNQQRPGNVLVRDLVTQRALSAFLGTTGFTIGREHDSVIRHFGNLGEGYQAVHISPDILGDLQTRFLRRRELAALARFPEGYEFAHCLQADMPKVPVIVLTPPDKVAVRDQEGLWYRRARTPQDPPATYTWQWYLDYLRSHSLPGWFMSDAHLVLLHETSETYQVGQEGVPIQRQQPPVDYLEVRYPHPPLYPRPTSDITSTYCFDVTERDQRALARQFPAVTAIPANSRVFVLPSGHIEIRHGHQNGCLLRPEPQPNEPLLPGSLLLWTSTLKVPLSSYVDERNIRNPGSTVDDSLTGDAVTRRDTLADMHREAGALVNPSLLPNGQGTWVWLEQEVDEQRARALGYNTPQAVTAARQNGLLALGIGPNAGPAVIFYPNAEFLNPQSRPSRHGHFEYLTAGFQGSSEDLAHLNFGGQDGLGFANIPRPTADDIFNYRQSLRQRGSGNDVDNPSNEIDIVWVPESEEDRARRVSSTLADLTRPARSYSSSPAPSLDTPPASSTQRYGRHASELDRDSGLVHEPTNRAVPRARDQTAKSGNGTYQTRLIPCDKDGTPWPTARPMTVDRSRAQVGRIDDNKHKLVILSNKGEWTEYKDWNQINWEDVKDVEKLNKWREQAYTRYGWPRKRTQNREEYTQEERRWVFDNYVASSDEASQSERIDFRQLTRLFNQHFQNRPQRNVAGLQSAYHRLRKEFAENDGKMKLPVKKGRVSLNTKTVEQKPLQDAAKVQERPVVEQSMRELASEEASILREIDAGNDNGEGEEGNESTQEPVNEDTVKDDEDNGEGIDEE